MNKSFNEWWNEHKKNGFVPTFSDVASNAFKAGQQSKQAEIDELKKRIDEAMKYVSESPLKDVSRRAMINFMDILKGNTNDH